MKTTNTTNVITLNSRRRYITDYAGLIMTDRNPDFVPPDKPLNFNKYDDVLILATRMHPDPERCNTSMQCNMELARRVAHEVEQRGSAVWYEASGVGDPELEIMMGGFSLFRVVANKANAVNIITQLLDELEFSNCCELLDCTCSLVTDNGIALPALTTSLYPKPGLTSEWATQIYLNVVRQIANR